MLILLLNCSLLTFWTWLPVGPGRTRQVMPAPREGALSPWLQCEWLLLETCYKVVSLHISWIWRNGAVFPGVHHVLMAVCLCRKGQSVLSSGLWLTGTPNHWSSTACILSLRKTAVSASACRLSMCNAHSGTGGLQCGGLLSSFPSPSSVFPWKTHTTLKDSSTSIY